LIENISNNWSAMKSSKMIAKHLFNSYKKDKKKMRVLLRMVET
jgi:hypothetical protein